MKSFLHHHAGTESSAHSSFFHRPGGFESLATGLRCEAPVPNWLSNSKAKFNELFGKTDGWAGDGSKAIPAELARLTLSLLDLLALSDVPAPSLSHDPAGGISFEWFGDDRRAELSLTATGAEYWFRGSEGYTECALEKADDLIELIRVLAG